MTGHGIGPCERCGYETIYIKYCSDCQTDLFLDVHPLSPDSLTLMMPWIRSMGYDTQRRDS